jgi:hypothetical protein
VNSKDWFIVGVRLIGVILLLSSVNNFVTFAEMQSARYASFSYLLHGFAHFFAAWLLLFGAAAFCRLFDWRSEVTRAEPSDDSPL